MQIRQATLDDTRAISALHRTQIQRWQRLTPQGQVEDLPYDDLTIYERWLHGGAWMSIETGALWLSHLLRGAGQPLIIEQDDEPIGYVEAFAGDEASPIGKHLHIGSMLLLDEALRDEVTQALIRHADAQGKISFSVPAYDNDTVQFYKRYAFKEVETRQEVVVAAQGGSVGFYKVSDHLAADATQITGWFMPIGRNASARQHWEIQWAHLWDAIPQITAQTTHRKRFNSAGLDAFVCVQQALYNPRSATVYCWTSKAITAQLIAAIRDWCYKQGYRTLRFSVTPQVQKLLGSDIELTPQKQTIFMRDSSI